MRKKERFSWRLRVWVGVGLVGVSGLLVAGWVMQSSGSSVGGFRSEEGRAVYTEAYDAAMGGLPQPARSMDIETDYGVVRVYEFSSEATRDSEPVVLLPGRTSGVPMWEENLKDLAEERTVYAMDALGDAGMSVQTRRIADARDQGLWLDQTLEQLDSGNVHLVGHSFGGWLAANYAVRHPEKVRSLTLLEPVFVLQGLEWDIYLKSLPASLPFLPQSWRDAMLGDFGGTEEIEPRDPMTQMISAATRHYSVKLPLPERIEPGQLERLDMPVYVALGSESSMHDSAAGMEVARQNIRNLQIKNWPGGTHSLPMENADELDREVLEFMDGADIRGLSTKSDGNGITDTSQPNTDYGNGTA